MNRILHMAAVQPPSVVQTSVKAEMIGVENRRR